LRRYALDVNVERADDVVTHQRLLEEARDPERRPALSVRVVQVRNPVIHPSTHWNWIYCNRMVACCTRVDFDLRFVQKCVHRFLTKYLSVFDNAKV